MPWSSVAIALVIAAATSVQSFSGFGFALLAVPLLSFLIDPKDAVVLLAVLGPPITISVALRHRHAILPRVVVAFTLPAIVGLPIGLWVLDHANVGVLSAVIAVVVIVLTLLLARGPSAALPRGTDVLAGFVSGVLSTSTSTSGPPLVLALQARGPSPDEFRGTIAASFLAQGWITLVAFWLAGRLDAEVGRLALIGLPGLVVGFVGGALLSRRVRPERFRSVVLALLVVTGSSLLIRSLVA